MTPGHAGPARYVPSGLVIRRIVNQISLAVGAPCVVIRGRTSGRQTRRGRSRERVRAVEIEGAERNRVVAAHRDRLGRRAAYLVALPDPADHPVLRLEPLEAPSGGRAARTSAAAERRQASLPDGCPRLLSHAIPTAVITAPRIR